MRPKNKVLFLDIDGVILRDPGYLHNPNEITFLPKVISSLRDAVYKNYYIVFISNKGGSFFHRGLTENGLYEIDGIFKKTLVDSGIPASSFVTYYCTHYPPVDCNCRKPKSGLFGLAIKELNISSRGAVVIGDKMSDLLPGLEVGCKTAILVKRNQEFFDTDNLSSKNIYYYTSLSDALEFALNKYAKK